MDVISDANGITIKKFLSKKVIPYSELKSVTINKNGINFTTKDGAVTTAAHRIMNDLGGLYKEIPNNRFSFADETELTNCPESRSIDEIQAAIPGIIKYAHDRMIDTVREKYGDEYDIVITDSMIESFIQLDFCLTKDGKAVQFFEAFDDISLAFLIQWDPVQGCGLYGVTCEFTDRDKLDAAIDYTLQYLTEHYKP